jgi:hypothetical protein
MNTDEYLNDLKKEYSKTEATWHLKVSGWEKLSRQIDPTEIKKNHWLKNFGIAFAVFAIFLLGTYKMASAALPGETLYPVKLISEEIIQKVSGSNQVAIDNRANEIISLSQEQGIDNQNLEQIVADYKENVNEARQSFEVTGKSSIDFQNKLDEQHSEFEKIGKDHPDIEDEIKDAKDASNREDHKNED